MSQLGRTAIIVVLVALGGCKDKDQRLKRVPAPTPPALGSAEPPAKAKPAAPTAAVFGKAIAPFGPLAGVKLGMTEAEVKAAAPAFWNAQGALTKVTTDDVALEYELELDHGTLAAIKIQNTALDDMEPAIVEAWGPGTPNKDLMGSDQLAWFDPAAGVRAIARRYDLELRGYLPLEQLLGPDPVAIAALPKPVLGATIAELERDYGDQFVSDSPAHLALPPTEWERERTLIFMYVDKNGYGKARDFHVEIPDKASPGGKDAAVALFTKKWGAPKLLSSYGAKDKTMVFHARNPLIEVDRTYDDSGWDLRVRAKDDACGGPCFKGL